VEAEHLTTKAGKPEARSQKSAVRNSGCEAIEPAYPEALAWQANPDRLEAEVAKMV
jgi:hypothetical protein